MRLDEICSTLLVAAGNCRRLREDFAADMDRAEQMAADNFAKRGFVRRTFEKLSHVVKPET